MSELLATKHYPYNYPQEAIDVINALTLPNGHIEILGSQALSSQQYAADYDLFQTVKFSYKRDDIALTKAVLQFQEMMKRLLHYSNLFIGDIKAGDVPQWDILQGGLEGSDVVGYSATHSLSIAQQMLSEGVLTEDEFEEAKHLLVKSPTAKQFVEAQKILRYNVIRWKPQDILKGGVTLRNGDYYSLMDAFLAQAPVKVDVVALVNGDYRDFSCIYQFSNGSTVFNNIQEDALTSIQQSANEYFAQGNYFKFAKRVFSLAKITGNDSTLLKLDTILNSDLGRLYAITSDIGTLLFLLENYNTVPASRLHSELDDIRVRLGNVYSVDVNTVPILKDIMHLEELPIRGKAKEKLINGLEHIQAIFEGALSVGAYKRLKEERLANPVEWW